MAEIVATRFLVEGIADEGDVTKALQALYDVFASQGLGQATFELVPGEAARLWVKHKASVTPSAEPIAQALARAGDYRVVDG